MKIRISTDLIEFRVSTDEATQLLEGMLSELTTRVQISTQHSLTWQLRLTTRSVVSWNTSDHAWMVEVPREKMLSLVQLNTRELKNASIEHEVSVGQTLPLMLKIEIDVKSKQKLHLEGASLT